MAFVDNANGDWDVPLGDKVWLAGAADYAGLLNQPVFIAENADGGFFIWVTGASNVITGVLADPLGDADDDGEPDCFVLADGTKVPYTEGECLGGTINHRPGRCRHELEQNPGADIAIAVGPDGVAVNFSATQFDSMFEDPTPHFFVVLDVLPEDPTYDAANPGTWMVVISTDGLFGPVPRTCQVTLNGQPAKITDLKVGDVIDAAIGRETAVSGYYPPFIIRAHREVVEGNVAGTSTSYPGPIDRVTIDLKTGGSKTYVVDHNGTVGGPRPGGPATSSSATGALPMAPRSSSSRISPLCLAKAGDLRTAL